MVNFKQVHNNCLIEMTNRIPPHTSSNPDAEALELFFGELFKKHEQTLYTLARRLTKSDQYAKDIIQEVFLKLWEHRQTVHTIHNTEAWLYRLTENKVIDFLRKAAADSRLQEAIWNKLPYQEEETGALVEAKEYSQIIQKAISQLPPQRKLIYQLNREEGLNYQEIADELCISRHTVKNQLSTALQAIRSFLASSTKFFFSLSSFFFIGQ
jgi:RNA polymerase sigma-70 factor (family 1)